LPQVLQHMITWGQARLTTRFPSHDGQCLVVFSIFVPLFLFGRISFFSPDNIKRANLKYFQQLFKFLIKI